MIQSHGRKTYYLLLNTLFSRDVAIFSLLQLSWSGYVLAYPRRLVEGICIHGGEKERGRRLYSVFSDSAVTAPRDRASCSAGLCNDSFVNFDA